MIDYTAVSRELPAKITGTAADGGAVAFMFQAPGWTITHCLLKSNPLCLPEAVDRRV